MPFSKWSPCQDTPCRVCLGYNVNFRTYEPGDESYEDYQYECVDCQKVWWIDGMDS